MDVQAVLGGGGDGLWLLQINTLSISTGRVEVCVLGYRGEYLRKLMRTIYI